MRLIVLFSILVVFVNIGNFLDDSKEPKKSEIIICLGGGDINVRIKKALELYQQGYSLKKLILITGGTIFTIKDNKQDSRISYIEDNMVNINYFYYPYTKNTVEELVFLKKFMIKNNYKKVLIVSDSYHTKRINILSSFIGFKKESLDIITVGTSLNWWDSSNYYTNILSIQAAFSELIKIPYNIIKYTFIKAI